MPSGPCHHLSVAANDLTAALYPNCAWSTVIWDRFSEGFAIINGLSEATRSLLNVIGLFTLAVAGVGIMTQLLQKIFEVDPLLLPEMPRQNEHCVGDY